VARLAAHGRPEDSGRPLMLDGILDRVRTRI